MGWLEQAKDFVANALTMEVMKERLVLWGERLDLAEAKNASLKEEKEALQSHLEQLKARAAELESENQELKAAEKAGNMFTEFRGALFRRLPSGKFDLPAVIAELRKEEGQWGALRRR